MLSRVLQQEYWVGNALIKSELKGYEGEGRVTLQVAAQIIEKISSGLYRSPESALKELVSNSFDADSPECRIKFYFDYKQGGHVRLAKIIVSDKGAGMNINALKYIFSHVGGSKKESDSNIDDPKTMSGRPMIGRLGIGMLSIASACDEFFVRTKKAGERREYLAEINLEYLKDISKRTQSMDIFSIGNVGLFSKSVDDEFSHYTEVEFSKFTPPFMESIQNRLNESFVFQNVEILPDTGGSENEQKLEDYFKKLINWTVNGGKLKTGRTKVNKGKLQAAHPLDVAVLNLGLMAPVQYLSDGPVRSFVNVDGINYQIPGTEDPSFIELKERYLRYKFNLYLEFYKEAPLEKTEILTTRFKIYKPLRYPTDDDIDFYGFETLQPKVYSIKPLRAEIPIDEDRSVNTLFSGYYYHQHTRILPQEYRGILFRVYNVAIGNRFQDDLKLYVTSPLILWQSICELYLDEGFQRIVNLDRESLYEGNNIFRHLRYFLENFLSGNVPEKVQLNLGNLLSNTEKKFFKLEKKLLKPGNGVINEIKNERKKKKNSEIDEPWKVFEDELLYREKCETLKVVERTDDIEKVRAVRSGKTLEVVLPKFHGEKMWDAIFLQVYLSLRDTDSKLRNRVLHELLYVFKEFEE